LAAGIEYDYLFRSSDSRTLAPVGAKCKG
jgi:hypothetical protein